MSQPLIFADSEYSSKRRQTQKEIFYFRMNNLLHGDEVVISGNAGCQGAEKREELT